MSKRYLGIPEPAWAPTIYGGAIFGGVFWMILSAKTTFFEAAAGTHSRLFALMTALVVAIVGGLIHLIPTRGTKILAVAIALGALLGLPVLGYFAIVSG